METLWLDSEAQRVIEAEATQRRLRETGGPLFGYEADVGGIYIARAFGPGPNARHWRFRYQPDRRDTQAAIEKVFAESEGAHLYLGEWHSHPLGSSRPSQTDVATLKAISTEAGVGLERPVALIQQTKTVRRSVAMGTLVAVRWEPHANGVRRMKVEATSGSAPER